MIQRPRQRSPAHERPQPPQQLKIPNSRAKELPRYLKPPRKDPLERNGRFAGTHMSFIRLPAVTTRHALVPDSARPAQDSGAESEPETMRINRMPGRCLWSAPGEQDPRV